MKIPANVDFVELPEVPDPATCRLALYTAEEKDPNSYAVILPQISPEEMSSQRQRWRGMRLRPAFFAISGKRLLFACDTDHELFAKLRYNPAAKEI